MGNKRGHVKDNHPQKPKKLLDVAKEILRRKHYSIRTEEAYIGWMVRYIHFHNKRHSENMAVPEIEAFLTHLAVEGNVAGSTRNQAFNAILVLYRNVLNISLEGAQIDAIRAHKKRNVPVVLTKNEAKRVVMKQRGHLICQECRPNPFVFVFLHMA